MVSQLLYRVFKQYGNRRRGGTVLLIAALLLPVFPAGAIVIRHDRADSSYIVEASRYPQLFYLHTRRGYKVCMATLISPRWAITAGHCVEDTPIAGTLAENKAYHLTINSEQYAIEALELHPQYLGGDLLQGVDLALIQLERDVHAVEPVQLNRQWNESSQIITLLGWGYTGTGTTGRRHNDGQLRRAENLVENAGPWLLVSFDDPREARSNALALEGVPGLGDSGGPALRETANGPVLLGVAIGELAGEEQRRRQGSYGAIGIYERISLHLDWIEKVTGLR